MAQAQYLQVRIWYTIDGSSQYILARSPDKFPVHPLGTTSSHRGTFATTSLKLCLHSICRSSPELMHFGQRDFSIYALDPSESDAAPNTAALASGSSSSQSHPSLQQPPPGVAVGMGLMSWALAAPDDSASVTGIMNTMASGESALEVVFALRGTLHTPQPPVFQLGTQNSNHWQSQTPVSAPMHMPPAQPMHLNQALHCIARYQAAFPLSRL
ncbi:hypothetical protein EDB92DRAFT_1593353 [Lactarius akahatsu]|uniref:Ams2/SPT21 N-terminal domain-containing protein n=1 Tax=Lactarius akahatsu TaxID=416441 RepID=A0AAD4LN28_9AGAM|nr:hypothetical protein EDB92DRAFT_1593353 [Lactarius akahatsu]